ncbi:MAG TPA: cytochrome C oxidase subunit IV family protein [Tepidisphaeraceae bacterium]|nr:cytochrome C oxidase subunit IV family protein [Tepidisphaeraceae bacterium]
MTHASPTLSNPRRPGAPPDPHAFVEPHVPVRTYLMIFAALMILMLLTVAAAFLPHQAIGNWSIIIALGIATIKAVLVILYFMHVKYASPLVKIVVISGFVWFFIALGLTFTDYLTRGWLPVSAGWPEHPLRANVALPDPVPGPPLAELPDKSGGAGHGTEGGGTEGGAKGAGGR